MDELITHAASIGCRVYYLPLPHTHYGYLATAHDIVVNSRLPYDFQREVLAHELGHSRYGHDLRTRHDIPKDERKADTYAAHLLITPQEYARAEDMYEGCWKSIACELGVSTKMVRAWQNSFR
ncbi:ImmA/IrrE family metallo-endopeptidase [Timonella sp. A28]|uniref:ImmA/IrrE family metallo-endopeptidase n=1 Tax=Timonella sp. A28 TaxID=3442640 RepID=UPI003EBDA046